MIEYLQKRSMGISAVLPQQQEIALLEVFKKLTESGWIIKLNEFKQILQFVGVDFVRTPYRHHNKELKMFVQRFAEEIGIESKPELEQLIGPEKKYDLYADLDDDED